MRLLAILLSHKETYVQELFQLPHHLYESALPK